MPTFLTKWLAGEEDDDAESLDFEYSTETGMTKELEDQGYELGNEDEFDDAYAIRLYREVQVDGRLERRPVESVAGVPTARSLAPMFVGGLPTIAMFANEPDATQTSTCRFVFPTVRAVGARLGDIHLGYLVTSIGVPKGASLTWCYSPPQDERAYPTACAPPTWPPAHGTGPGLNQV